MGAGAGARAACLIAERAIGCIGVDALIVSALFVLTDEVRALTVILTAFGRIARAARAAGRGAETAFRARAAAGAVGFRTERAVRNRAVLALIVDAGFGVTG